MKDTILGEIYSAFTKDELKKLDKYIHASEWSESPRIVRCHEYYSHSAKGKDKWNFEKKSLFYYIYSGETYNDTKLRFTQNRLLNAIKQFIINLEYEKDNVFTSKIWMDFLMDKKLKKNLQYHSQEKKIVANSDYRFLNEYFKSQEESHIIFQNPKEQEKQYQTIQNVIEKAQLFSDLVFIRNFCSLLTFSHTFQSVPIELPTEKLHSIKERTDIEKYPEFKVYMYAIDLLIGEDKNAYQNYKKTLFETLENWEDQEKINLLVYLLNYTTQQINQGKREFIDEQYNLFLEFEKRNIFQTKNYINHNRINNVVIIYLRKNEFQKAEDFLNKYISFLSEDLMDSCRHYNKARIFFEKKFYKESLRELMQVDFSKDPFYSINSKVLLYKTYFELNETDALDSLFTSFKEFIRKNKVVSETHKSNCLSFVKLSKKLYDAKTSEYIAIEKTIESTAMIEKNWLLEKVQSRIKHNKVKS